MTMLIRRPNRRLRLFEPLHRPLNLFEEFEELFRESLPFRANIMPETDMYEQDGELVIKTDQMGQIVFEVLEKYG